MGTETSRLALPARGERVGEYTVLAEIASGGMAAVFAVHRSVAGPQKLLAMKLLLPNLAQEARFVEMFLDEAKIAARIQHPNVVPVFDVGSADGRPFIVMELLHGQTLAALLERTKPRALPTPVIYGILAQVARGLHGAHEALGPDGKRLDVVHRDVSPHNVHVSYDGQVRVVDFGIAVARGRISSTRTGELKGKLAYLAPEQIDRTQVVGPKADLWSFGVMAYEALSGSRPFQGDDEARALWAVLHQEVEHLAERVSGLDPRVVEMVGRCLKRPIEERPASAAEIALVFEEAGAAASWAIAAEMSSAFAAERQQGSASSTASARRRWRGPSPPSCATRWSSARALGPPCARPWRWRRCSPWRSPPRPSLERVLRLEDPRPAPSPSRSSPRRRLHRALSRQRRGLSRAPPRLRRGPPLQRQPRHPRRPGPRPPDHLSPSPRRAGPAQRRDERGPPRPPLRPPLRRSLRSRPKRPNLRRCCGTHTEPRCCCLS